MRPVPRRVREAVGRRVKEAGSDKRRVDSLAVAVAENARLDEHLARHLDVLEASIARLLAEEQP